MIHHFAEGGGASRRDRVKVVAAAVFLIASLYLMYSYFSADMTLDQALDRGFMCSACGHSYAYRIKSGDYEPMPCPACRAQAAYQAERCYWTKLPDGSWGAKAQPTYVLLKTHVDPATDEKTFCPECGHEVVGHNPMPPKNLMDGAAAEARD